MRSFLAALLLVCASANAAEWQTLTPGVDYARHTSPSEDIHAVRVDLSRDNLRVISTPPAERGLRVSEFAKKHDAIVAINANYFDEKLRPIGLALGPCGSQAGPKDTTRWGVVAVGRKRAAIYPQKHVLKKPAAWMDAIVSGWPLLASSCTALASRELPGSDHFTRAPHARTAIGLSRDGKTLFIVVADGGREKVRGVTLDRLGQFMVKELGACSVMNLDGGSSSALWVGNRIVSDTADRRVGNHLAVINARDYPRCETE